MNKPSLTLVEIAEMASGANTELPDGLYRAAPNLYVQIRGESASYVLRWYRGSHVSTMGLGSLRKVTFDERELVAGELGIDARRDLTQRPLALRLKRRDLARQPARVVSLPSSVCRCAS